METRIAQEMIRVFRAERDRRSTQLFSEGEPADPWAYDAYDQWVSNDQPFINELCLTLLVAIWHQVERELVWIAARVTKDGRELEGHQYQKEVQKERRQLRGKGWKKITAKLQLDTLPEWNSSMETLRLLANSYKHDPSTEPDEKLLGHLGLNPGVSYAALPDSDALKEGLAASLNLQDDADYCDISDELLTRAERFLAEVRKQLTKKGLLSRIKPRLWQPGDIAY